MEKEIELSRKKAQLLFISLKKALAAMKGAIAQPPTVYNQDSSIKRFEFTFELSWKLIKTIVELDGLTAPSPRSAIRQAASIGLIDDPLKWFEFLDGRNLTVHTYKEEIAQKVYQLAKEFIPYVEVLLVKSKEYLDKLA